MEIEYMGMDENHSAFQENLAAYALGALDAEEIAALENHLRTCESCRAELADYERVSSGLLSALPPRPLRPGARRRLQNRLAGRAVAPHPRFTWSLGPLVSAVLLVALIALNMMTISEVRSLQREQAELLKERTADQTAISMLAYPTTRSIAFDNNGVSGSLLVDKQRNLLAIFAWNMKVAPGGKTYQLWLIDPQGNRTSGGFVVPETGYPFVMTVIHSPQPLRDFTGLGITVEPAGGSTKPTGPRILHVDF